MTTPSTPQTPATLRAIELLRESASELLRAHTVGGNGDWTGEPDAKAAHDELLAVAAALAAQPPAEPKYQYTDGTLSTEREVLDAVGVYARTRPEDGESWESWYEAAFDMTGERIRAVFRECKQRAGTPPAVAEIPEGSWVNLGITLPEPLLQFDDWLNAPPSREAPEPSEAHAYRFEAYHRWERAVKELRALALTQPPAGQQDSNHVPDSTKKVNDIPDAGNMIQGGQQDRGEALGYVDADDAAQMKAHGRGCLVWADAANCDKPVSVYLGAPATAGQQDSADQLLGMYAMQADVIRALLDKHAPNSTGNLQARIAQVLQSSGTPVAWAVPGNITDWSRDFSAYQTKTYTRPVYATAGEATAAQGADWRSIETAPRDGRHILGFMRGCICEAFLTPRNDCEMWTFGMWTSSDGRAKPTHWMPLPAAPSPAAPGNGEGGK